MRPNNANPTVSGALWTEMFQHWKRLSFEAKQICTGELNNCLHNTQKALGLS